MSFRFLLAVLAALAVVCLGCGPTPTADELPGDDGVANWSFEPAPVPDRDACPDSVRDALLSDTGHVWVRCNLDLHPTDTTRSVLILQGEASSGVTVDCHGGTLDGAPALLIRSVCSGNDCEPVHDVTVRDCQVRGSVSVHGISTTGNGELLQLTHDTLEHVSVVRGAAPYHLILNGLDIVGTGHVPLYLGPGTHDSAVVDTSLGGESRSVMLYADAETTGLQFTRLEVDATGAGRADAIAWDGSSDNVLEDSEVVGGGLYLYRNCGEAGVSRHATPSGNLIQGNTFSLAEPCIWFGSRGGRPGYCGEDDGSGFGSGISDFDWARNNTGSGNRFRGCSVWHGNRTNSGNEVE